MPFFQIFEEKKKPDIFSSDYLTLREKVPVSSKKKRVIVISGPTAVGKTDLSLKIAERIGGEIISADAMQIYKGMDIGTAKISLEDQKRVPHHMIDICDVQEEYNAGKYYHAAHAALRDILLRNKVPIIVGGSGFYLRVFLYGPPPVPPSSPEVRHQIEEQMEKLGIEQMYERLQMLDGAYASTISEKDKHKIARALEIIAITQKPISSIPFPPKNKELAFDYRLWFLYLSKEELSRRIELRCDEMLFRGFVEEVRRLEKEGLRNNRSASLAIGYRQCLEFLKSSQTEEDYLHFVAEFKQVSRNYVKKQLTWFRKESFFRWLNLEEIDEEKAIEFILQDYEQGD
jgi:tRNA dimethylallyltransferase